MMSDDSPDDPEIRKFEREMEHREKNLEAANEMLKDAPGLLGELTNEVVLPLLKSLQPQQNQPMWSPPEGRQQRRERRNRGTPEYDPFDDNNQDVPGPQEINNEDDNNS